MICGIYKITSPCNKIYIGQSIDIESRFKSYRKYHCKRQPKLYNSLKKYGSECHTFEIFQECSIEQLNLLERKYQEEFNSINEGLNCRYTKTDEKSGFMDMESSIKKSIALKGKKRTKSSWNKGIKTQIITKGCFKKGYISKKKGKENFKIKGENHPFYNKKRPEFSENQKGNKNHRFGKIAKNAKIITNIITGEEFPNIKEAANFYNIKYSTLRSQFRRNKNQFNLKFKN